MEPALKKQKSTSPENMTGNDRLTELPDKVLINILSFLPTMDAVRTVLIRRFGNLWTLIPTLDFNEDTFGSSYESSDADSFARFSSFVDNVLNLHKSPTIDKFRLLMSVVDWTESYEAIAIAEVAIETWMKFALTKEVKELMLYCDNGNLFSIPSSIFKSQSLVMLKLERCRIELPKRARMGSLRTLKLVYAFVESGDLNAFVSGCPSLQELVILSPEIFRKRRNVKLCAPSIEVLDIWDMNPGHSWTINCVNLKVLHLNVFFDSVEVVNASSVREVTVGFFYCDGIYDKDAHEFKRFLEMFQNAEVVTLAEEAVLQLNDLRSNVGFPHNKWKCVVLRTLIQDNTIAGICRLVRDSPCVEELAIHVEEDQVFCTTRGRTGGSQEAVSPCVAPHLKLVSVRLYKKPCAGELRLVEFLLKSAVNLDELVILSSWSSPLTSAEKLQFVQQLSNLPRASTKRFLKRDGELF